MPSRSVSNIKQASKQFSKPLCPDCASTVDKPTVSWHSLDMDEEPVTCAHPCHDTHRRMLKKLTQEYWAS